MQRTITYDFTQTSTLFSSKSCLSLCDLPSGDCSRSSGGCSMWCRPHGGAGEVPPVSKWIKRLDVWMSPPPLSPPLTSKHLREPIGGHAGVLKPAGLHRWWTLMSLRPAVTSDRVQSSWSCSKLTQLTLSWHEGHIWKTLKDSSGSLQLGMISWFVVLRIIFWSQL